MLPSFVLLPRGVLELVACAIAALTTGIAARYLRVEGRVERREAALFVLYLFGGLGVALLGHALVGGAPVVVSSYAALLGIGTLAAWAILWPRLLRIGLGRRVVFTVLLGSLVVGVAGARLASALYEGWHGGASQVLALLPQRRGGLGVFGAFAADLVFLVVLLRRAPRGTLSRTLDASASAMAVSLAVGRVGCLLAGCCFGAPAASGWLTIDASAFSPASPAGAAYANEAGVAIWATQPIEAALVACLGVGCEALYRARARLELRDGAVVCAFALGYGALRTVLEMARGDSPRAVLGIMTVWQTVGLLMCAAAIAVWHRVSSRSPACRPGSATRAARAETRGRLPGGACRGRRRAAP